VTRLWTPRRSRELSTTEDTEDAEEESTRRAYTAGPDVIFLRALLAL